MFSEKGWLNVQTRAQQFNHIPGEVLDDVEPELAVSDGLLIQESQELARGLAWFRNRLHPDLWAIYQIVQAHNMRPVRALIPLVLVALLLAPIDPAHGRGSDFHEIGQEPEVRPCLRQRLDMLEVRLVLTVVED